MPEIHKLVDCCYGSVWKYIQNVQVLPKYKEILRIKQGGSKERSLKKWKEAGVKVKDLIKEISQRDLLIFLAGIYWGEGSKNEFNLINGDPYLIRSVIQGLKILKVNDNQIKFNFRVYSGMLETEIIDFWVKFLDINKTQIGKTEFVIGNGTNRLSHGMCRVRVSKGGVYFKEVMSMIDLLKNPPMPL